MIVRKGYADNDLTNQIWAADLAKAIQIAEKQF